MAIPNVNIKITVEGGKAKAEIGRVSSALTDFASEAKRAAGSAATSLDQVGASAESIANGLSTLRGVAESYLSLQGLKSVVGTLVNTQLQLQEVKYGLEAAGGSARAGADEFQYLSELAERVGVRLIDAGQAYAGYMTAAKAANLTTAETRELFTSLAEAGAVFNLSQGKMQSAMIALQQMMALGTIRSQELNYQLGQAIPGSAAKFKTLVEEKLGPGTFSEALSKGLLDVKTFGPLLGEAIRSLYNPEVLAKAAGDLNSQLAKMENSLVRFKNSLSQGLFTETVSAGLGELTKIVDFLAGSNEELEKAQRNLEDVRAKGQEAIDSGELARAEEAVKAAQGLGALITTYGLMTAAVIAFTRALNFGITKVVEAGAALKTKALASQTAAAAAVAQAEAEVTETAAIVANTEALAANLRVREAELIAEQAQAVAAAKAIEVRIASIRADLGKVGSTERLVAAEAALTAAQTREAASAQALTVVKAEQEIVEGRLTTAKAAATTATATLTTAQTAATAATGAFTVAGRGLLALLGGWPGVILLAVGALAYLASQTNATKQEIIDLGTSIDATQKKMKELSSLASDIKFAEQNLSKAIASGDQARVDQARAALQQLRAGAGQALKENSAAQTQALREQSALQSKINGLTQQEQKIRGQIAALPKTRATGGQLGRLNTELKVITDARLEAERQVHRVQQGLARERNSSDLAYVRRVEQEELASASRVAIQERVTQAETAAKAAADKAKLAAAPVATQRQAFVDAGIASLKSSDDYKRLSQAEQREAVNQLTTALRTQAQAEIGATSAKNSGSAATREASRAERDRKSALEDVERGIESFNRETENAEQSQRSIKEEMDGAADSTTRLNRKIEDLKNELLAEIQAVNESTLSQSQKTAAIDSLTAAYDRATTAVTDLAQAELSRDQQQALKQLDENLAAQSREARQAGQTPEQNQREDAEARRQEAIEQLDASGLIPGTEEYERRMVEIQNIFTTTMDNMQTKADETAKLIEDRLANDIYQLMQGNWREVLLGWARLLQQMVAKFIASKIMDYLKAIGNSGSSTGGSSGSGGFFSQLIGAAVSAYAGGGGGYAEGGSIEGPGTPTSDNLLIAASPGEFMVRAKAVRKYGRGLLESINRGEWLPNHFSRFADGGMIDGVETAADSSMRFEKSGGWKIMLKNINLFDPEMAAAEVVKTRTHERATVNHVINNSKKVRQGWGSDP